MEFLFNLLLFLHFVGLAGALGGFLAQLRSAEKGITPLMLHGALTQWVTGVLMTVMFAASWYEAENWTDGRHKWEAKFLVATVIAVVALLGWRTKLNPRTAWILVGALEVVNVLLAVFWAVGG